MRIYEHTTGSCYEIRKYTNLRTYHRVTLRNTKWYEFTNMPPHHATKYESIRIYEHTTGSCYEIRNGTNLRTYHWVVPIRTFVHFRIS